MVLRVVSLIVFAGLVASIAVHVDALTGVDSSKTILDISIQFCFVNLLMWLIVLRVADSLRWGLSDFLPNFWKGVPIWGQLLAILVVVYACANMFIRPPDGCVGFPEESNGAYYSYRWVTRYDTEIVGPLSVEEYHRCKVADLREQSSRAIAFYTVIGLYLWFSDGAKRVFYRRPKWISSINK